MIKAKISQLLDTEMERKDFLKLVGLGAVAATGLSAVLKAVSQSPSRQPAAKAPGYGGSLYGGVTKK